jgi:hypothetical protein
MYQDYKDLLSAFQSHGVKYLVVGGFAVIYHSQPRFTTEMDLFIKADTENAKATTPPVPSLVHRSKASPQKISPIAIVFFGLGASRKASISFQDENFSSCLQCFDD